MAFLTLQQLKDALIAARDYLQRLQSNISTSMPTQTANGQLIYTTARSLIGKHVIPLTPETDYGVLGCAASVNAVVKRAIGVEIGGGASTALMLAFLMNTTRFESVLLADALPGDIIISATGKSTYYPNVHGHVGICGQTWIMSNSSEDGTWEANYTYSMWKAHYGDMLGFPIQVFRVL